MKPTDFGSWLKVNHCKVSNHPHMSHMRATHVIVTKALGCGPIVLGHFQRSGAKAKFLKNSPQVTNPKPMT
jgi:hypothetical protein